VEQIVEKVGDVKIYGRGSMGGKGSGLVKINERSIPQAHKLRTRILTTDFYDRFLDNDNRFPKSDRETFSNILGRLGPIPVSVRSSATNEAVLLPGGDSVHAGENASFMLPNNHADPNVRFEQLLQAIAFVYRDFTGRQPPGSREKMAVVINPIPGVFSQTHAGPVYYPQVSGVANSFFPHALKTQSPEQGFARLAFGHGYATVLDDFPVISMATIHRPVPVQMLGPGQKYFYAIDMTRNHGLSGRELETMRRLHVRFADSRLIRRLGQDRRMVTLSDLVEKDRFGFRSNLIRVMETIAGTIDSHFQIEFVFNIDPRAPDETEGTFHVVQLTPLPKMTFNRIRFPRNPRLTYLSIGSLQGHGVKRGIRAAIVVSPFLYNRDMHDSVRREIARQSGLLTESGVRFILIAPGRLGSTNRDWGIQVDYKDIGRPDAIFEYGVDVSGRPEPVQDPLTGGAQYGSHFLYMIQGGFDEEKRRIQTRMFGTQGTHFLTNLMSNNIIYGFIAPLKDTLDPWFLSPPDAKNAVYVLRFPRPVTVLADSLRQKCVCIQENGGGA